MADHTQHPAMEELAYLFTKDQPIRPVLLLGAGASYRSGIPLAADLISRIASAGFARDVRGMDWRHCRVLPSDWRPYLYSKEWYLDGADCFVNNYAPAVQNILTPREFRREFFEEIINPTNGISTGYRDLVELVRRGLAWTILTTNFDHLVAEAFRSAAPPIRDFVEINKTQDDWVRFNIQNRRQIVYMHGAVEFYTDKNLISEVARLDDRISDRLRPLVGGSPLIVIGYRGSEPSIIEGLLIGGSEACNNYPHGIYWCSLEGETLHPNVQKLASLIGTNFKEIVISGFDETMEFINQKTQDQTLFLTSESTAVSTHDDSFESAPLLNKGVEDLDSDLIRSVLKVYCERLRLPASTADNPSSLLLDLGLLVKVEETLRPTRACMLLFGNDPTEEFPFALIAYTKNDRDRTVFSGNIISQYKELTNFLSNSGVNSPVRLKREFTSEEVLSYPNRAISEIVVNMLVHRDYEQRGYGMIAHIEGQSLTFTSPGGLPQAALNKIQPLGNGEFVPKRNVSEVRNGAIADIFWGLGPMDKAGSGLIDTQQLMLENGGSSRFSIHDDNASVEVTLLQPIRESAGGNTALMRNKRDVYTTNLLSFSVFPEKLFFLPLRDKMLIDTPLFREDDGPLTELPIFIKHDGNLISFANWEMFPNYANKHGLLEKLSSETVSDLGPWSEMLMRWLLGKHWVFFLREKSAAGLRVEDRKRRAYFTLVPDTTQNVITYESRAKRKTRRAVVKRRERGETRVEHENEGIYYSIQRFASEWTLQLKPMYVFTGKDGQTPIPSWLTSKRATRRFKFDRNKNVDDDLAFWSKYLSEGKGVRNIGGVGVTDLILDFEYCSAEVPIESRKASTA